MWSKKEIKDSCEKYNYKCRIFPNAVYITSLFDEWIIEEYRQKLILRHFNKKHNINQSHVQYKSEQISDIFYQIHKHDMNKLGRRCCI